MPNESVKFIEVDLLWRKLMANIKENTKVTVFTKNRAFLDDLNLCFDNIEIV
jgi:hypothetical protein